MTITLTLRLDIPVRPMGAKGLTYLHSYLSGYALKIISHLSVTNDNYDVAFSLLKEEFLDIPYIGDESFKTVLSSSPSFDTAFDGLRTYVNECRAIIHDLKHYDIDLMEEDTAGCKLLSHIIFSKLPTSVKRELVHKVDNNYPSLTENFDNYREIIKTLVSVSKPRDSSAKSDNGFRHKGNSHGLTKQSPKQQTPSKANPTHNSSPSTLENFITSMSNVESKPSPRGSPNPKKSGKHCELCSGPHSMSQCDNYKSLSDRQVRCVNLQMCKLCTSYKHNASFCLGKDDKLPFVCLQCKSHSHITSLCPDLSSENVSSRFCVNVLNLTFYGIGKCSRRVRCLLDSGSQRSYLSKDIIEYLKRDLGFSSTKYEINMFLGSAEREFGECILEVSLLGYGKDHVHILAASNFNVKLNVSQLDTAVHNIVKEGYNLAEPSLADDGEQVPILGLAGVDIIQCFPEFALTSCMLGAAFSTSLGLIPFGNILNFLYPGQAMPVQQLQARAERADVNNSSYCPLPDDEMLQSSVKFVMSPTKSYFSPLESCFPKAR